MATYTETDDASHRARVAARGLGACVRARAHKPEQTLSLQGSRYVDLSAFPAVFRRPGRWAKRCGRRPIDLNPPNLKRSTPGRVYRECESEKVGFIPRGWNLFFSGTGTADFHPEVLEKARPISPLAEIRQNNSRKNCGKDLNSTLWFAPFYCLCVRPQSRDY